MNAELAECQVENTKNTIFITGAPRSGTSILGKLISTLEGIDYHFEPPTLYVMAGMISMGALPCASAIALLRAYFHEDLLCPSVSGIRANLRPGDDSLVLHSISWEELLSRWHDIRNRADALEYIAARKIRLAVKMPSILDTIPVLARGFSQSRFVIIKRDGRDVVRSIVKKQWLSDEGLRESYWPYKIVDGRKLPHLVEDSVAEKWTKWNAPTRACYIWRRDAEFGLQTERLNMANRLHVVSYEGLTEDPESVIRGIGRFLSTRTTGFTRSNLAAVRPRQAANGRDDGIFRDVEPDELKKFDKTNVAMGYGDVG